MPEPGTMTTQVEEGSSFEQNGSQATVETPKEAPQPQETTPAQGREPDQAPPSNGDTRKPKASDFYGFRKKFDEQSRLINELQDQIKNFSKPSVAPPAPKTSTFNKEKFWENPEEVMKAMLEEKEKSLREQWDKELNEKIPTYLSEKEKQMTFVRNTQEAFELIFPKTDTNDKRSEEERALADPDKLAKVNQILKDTGLDLVTQTDPKRAAQAVLRILNAETKAAAPPKNPNVIKKVLAGSTATGSPINNAGGKQMATLQEIKAQLNELDRQLDQNPNLRYEDAWKNRNNELKNQLSVLAKELKGKSE